MTLSLLSTCYYFPELDRRIHERAKKTRTHSEKRSKGGGGVSSTRKNESAKNNLEMEGKKKFSAERPAKKADNAQKLKIPGNDLML